MAQDQCKLENEGFELSAVLSGGQASNYREWLLNILKERKKLRPRYSLRALAQSLGISPATFSQVLSGKRRLTEKSAMKIAKCLGLSPLERDALLELCHKEDFPELPPPRDNTRDWTIVSDDLFRIISHWYHYAILEMTDIENHQGDPEWMGKKLGISLEDASSALNRLLKLGLLQRMPEGKLKRTSKPLTVGDNIPSEAIREHHLSQLLKASYSLRHHSMNERYFSSGTMAIDSKNLPKAQEAIKSFRRKLCKMLQGGKPDRVYIASFQLFPASQEVI